MELEVLIGILAVFISGGALGIGTTLFCQWTNRKLSWKPYHDPSLERPEVAMLRSDVADLSRTVLDLNARVEFQEQLLAGGSPRRLPAGARPGLEPTPPFSVRPTPVDSAPTDPDFTS
jgi:hypothetical protein